MLTEQLNKLDKKLSAIFYTQSLMEWDAETIASKKGIDIRAEVAGEISEIYYKAFLNDEVKELLSALEEVKEDLDEVTKAKLRVYKKKYDDMTVIPIEDFSAYQILISKSYNAWEQAKEKTDFNVFAPYLNEIINYQKKFIKLRNKGCHPYDTLLNDFEPGVTVEMLDEFFGKLREQIVPLVKNICDEQSPKPDFLNNSFDVEKQEEVSKYLMKELGFEEDRGLIATSVHPFTLNLSRDDVRITTAYREDDIMSSIFSTVHETGHGMYEQNISDEFGLSALTMGISMGIHESQSRLYENNLGRNINFWKHNFCVLKDAFPEELKEVNLSDWYFSINRVQKTLIRIDADEITYPLHIMVRYEIEKKIFSEDIDVSELPKLWDDLYEEYLGIRPKNDGEGILQDVHWSGGAFGYFPSYALGSAYAAQFEASMRKDFDLEEALRNGEMSKVKIWLKDNIHKYGSSKKPDEIIKEATGESFNPDYFINYLRTKYNK